MKEFFTNLFQMHPFSTPWKHQKALRYLSFVFICQYTEISKRWSTTGNYLTGRKKVGKKWRTFFPVTIFFDYFFFLTIIFTCLYVIIMSRTSFKVNLYSIVCLNVKELLARSRRYIWSLSEFNGIRTHNHLVRKRTLNHLAKLAKWLSCVVSTCLHGAFDCMLLSCHVRVSNWIYTL